MCSSDLTLAALSVGKAPGPESSILKIVGTELAQKMDEMFVELAGYNCLPFVPEQFEPGFDGDAIGPGDSASAALTYFNNRKLSIFGGSNEIQRNIIGDRVLGLPRDISVDTGVAFKELKVGTQRS